MPKVLNNSLYVYNEYDAKNLRKAYYLDGSHNVIYNMKIERNNRGIPKNSVRVNGILYKKVELEKFIKSL